MRIDKRLRQALGGLLGALLAGGMLAGATALPRTARPITARHDQPGKGKPSQRKGAVDPAVTSASPLRPVTIPAALGDGFSTQTRLGFDVGDQWEPAIAADRFGHVYVLYSQYEGVPGCPSCANPTQILQRSADHGSSFGSPAPIDPAAAAAGPQWDSQIVVDPADGRTLFASWMQNNKSDIVVARSDDFGATFRSAIADATSAGTDKPILAVRGDDVYVVYNHSQTVWSASSHDGGRTFREVKVNHNGKLGWSLAGGGTVTPSGTALFAWAGYEGSGGAKSAVNLYVSRSSNGGASWTSRAVDVSSSPPDCAAYNCGWAYLGAQAVMSSDAAGTVYLAWNAGASARGAERLYFARSIDDGVTFSARRDVSTAPAGAHHAFPALAASQTGDVRIAWMDARAAGGGQERWNVYYRASADGGASWTGERDLSPQVPGLPYLFSDGFRYPFGDYWEMDLDETGAAHLIFGEGYDYDAPGSIWYVQGR